MKKPLITVTADVHMEKHPYADKRAMQWDASFGLEQVVNISIVEDIPHIVMAGDNFNVRQPGGDEVDMMMTHLNTAVSNHKLVHFIQGQHCMQPVPWPSLFRWVGGTRWIHKKSSRLVLSDLRIYGLDWTPPDMLPQCFDEMPETDILVMHQVWANFMPPGDKVKPECMANEVPGFVKMLITGDFHDHRSLAVTNRDGRPMSMLSPGPVCMQNLAENENKYCFVVYDDLSFESRKLKTRRCFRYLLRDARDLEVFLADCAPVCVVPQEGVPDYITTNVVEVRYANDIPQAYQRIHRVLDKKVHYFIKPVPVSNAQGDIVLAPSNDLLSMNQAIYALPGISDEDKAGAVRLHSSENPAAELSVMRDEFLASYKK